MREILFRGKTKNLKKHEWVHGQLLHHSERISKIYSDEVDYPVGVIPDTVGQYVGVKDKMAKKIFEGDILRIEMNLKTGAAFAEDSEVYFEDGCFCVNWAGAKQRIDDFSASCVTFEVVGNIHENEKGEVKNE